MIHPTAIVETQNIGSNVYIGPFCYITKDVVIGDNCSLYGYCSIGADAQFKETTIKSNGIIEIGNNVNIREFVAINRPTNGYTVIGDNCLLMCHTHIGHDSILSDNVTLVTGACLAGHTKIGNFSIVGLNSSTHQFSDIGSFCMIGANSFFKGKSPNGLVWAGVPSKPVKINIVGLDRYCKDKDIAEYIKMDAINFIQNEI